MITTKLHFSTGFTHLAEGLWKSSVYFKWLNKHTFVLFKPPKIASQSVILERNIARFFCQQL